MGHLEPRRLHDVDARRDPRGAIALELGLLDAVFVAAVMNLGVAIPSSPGFVGNYEWLGVASLGLLGIASEEALASRSCSTRAGMSRPRLEEVSRWECGGSFGSVEPVQPGRLSRRPAQATPDERPEDAESVERGQLLSLLARRCVVGDRHLVDTLSRPQNARGDLRLDREPLLAERSERKSSVRMALWQVITSEM